MGLHWSPSNTCQQQAVSRKVKWPQAQMETEVGLAPARHGETQGPWSPNQALPSRFFGAPATEVVSFLLLTLWHLQNSTPAASALPPWNRQAT